MAYEKLLVSAGGGIISGKQQSEQAKDTASILIGLGGTGIDCLRTIKTQVYSRLIPDNAEAVSPEYSHIRFIGVDTDESSVGKKLASKNTTQDNVDARLPLDEVTEFFSIVNPKVDQAVKNAAAMAARREMSWYNPATPPPKVGADGAGAIRQIGRFMLMDKADSFMNKLGDAIRSAKIGLVGPGPDVGPQVNIHIFAGISGGTGSGTFLDVCYMVREVAKAENVKIFGYFFLPDVNLSRIDFDNGKIAADMIMRNGYAAMQELDFCMNLPDNGGSFVQAYKGGVQIPWDTKPVDMCHLICASDEAGHSIANPYLYAMNVAAEYVMDFLTAPVDETFGLKSHEANFVNAVSTADSQKRYGVNLAYCVIGAASARLPLREINTYLASELFEKFSGIGSAVPMEQDVQDLAAKALGRGTDGDLYESLLKELEDGADVYNFSYYPEPYTYVLQAGDEDFTHHYSDQLAAKRGVLEKNAKSMAEGSNVESLINRVHAYLFDVMRDVERGPIYAYGMLAASEKNNLGNVIDGLIKTNDSRLSQAHSERNNTRDFYDSARNNFLNRVKRGLFDNDKNRFTDYENAARNEIDSQLAVYIYTQLGLVLSKLKEQVQQAAAGYYYKLQRVMTQLLETFRTNRADLAKGVTSQTDTFSTPLLTIAEIKTTLDAEIQRIDIPNMMSAFMELLLDNESAWIEEDESKIARLVTKFFTETAFKGYADRSITLFLQDKYWKELGTNPEDVELLSDLIYNNWITVLTRKASPLFVKDSGITAVDSHTGLSYISMPNASTPIKLAAAKMKASWESKASALTDRIFAMCSRYVLPIASYSKQGEYGDKYYLTRSSGVHLYEGGKVPGMAFNDWGDLPPLTPNYFLNLEKATESVQTLVSSARELYRKAREQGVIDEDNWICAPSAEQLEQLRSLTAKSLATTAAMQTIQEASAAEPLLERMNAALALTPVRDHRMQSDGENTPEVRERVSLDHFVASPNYQLRVSQILSDMTAAIAEGKRAAAALSSRIKEKQSEVSSLGNYCDALFTGVITAEGATVSYTRGGVLKKEERNLIGGMDTITR